MELSLDLSLIYVPRTVCEFLKQVAKLTDVGEKLSKLEEYVNRLEDERRKIEVFRRELPLCLLLLNDAISKLKEEALRCKELEDQAAAAEKIACVADDGMGNKKSWMDSVQLWKSGESKQLDCKSEQKQRSEDEDDRSTCENPIQQLPNLNHTGKAPSVAFKPIVGSERKEEKEVVSQVTELSLMTPAPPELISSGGRALSGNVSKQVKLHQPQLQTSQQLYPHKKQRRCWAPELHRLFVDVLKELGGPQVATPKQIRERMQVEGLTNDEVKSHLQKYRLHIRKHPASSAGMSNGLWMPKCDGIGNSNHTPNLNVSKAISRQGPLIGSVSAGGKGSSCSNDMEDDNGDDEKSGSHDSSKGGSEKVAGREVNMWRCAPSDCGESDSKDDRK